MLSNHDILRRMDARKNQEPGYGNLKGRSSVRELEAMAEALRCFGDERGAERLELRALSLLDRKICKKIINQSRRAQRRLEGSAQPFMEKTG